MWMLLKQPAHRALSSLKTERVVSVEEQIGAASWDEKTPTLSEE